MKRKLTDNPDVFYLAFDTVQERVDVLTSAGLFDQQDGSWANAVGVRAVAKPGDVVPLVFKVSGAFEAERQLFEVQAARYEFPTTRAGRGYHDTTTQTLWLGWQIARRAQGKSLYQLREPI